MTNHLSALPAEVLHLILNKLPMDDIFTSICFVSEHLRAVCLTYPYFTFDFSSFAKKKKPFDAVCAQLPAVASQIRSITFSSRFDNQRIRHFFSRLVLTPDTFSRLHSISLCSIDVRTWHSINSRLTSFPSLVTLTIECYENIDNSLASELLRELLYDSRSLKRLRLKVSVDGYDPFVVDPRLDGRQSSIEHLSVYGLFFNLAPLLEVQPALQSLNLDRVWLPLFPPPAYQAPNMLRHLSIKSFYAVRYSIEVMLNCLVHLTHLTLILDEVLGEMADGFAWARLLKSISIFKFRFKFTQYASVQPASESFRTPFWLNEKHWYVTYERCIDTGFTMLYSDPYCHDDYPFHFIKDSTIRVSTSPHPPSSPPMTYLSTSYPMSDEMRLPWWYSTVTRSSLHDCGKNLRSRLDYATKHLHVSDIVAFEALDYEPRISSDAFVKFVQRLPRLRKLNLSIFLVKQLLVAEWPLVRDLRIRIDLPFFSAPLTLTDAFAIARSFEHLERLVIPYHAIDNIFLLLNSRKLLPMLAQIWIHTDDDTIHHITESDLLKKNTKMRPFHYSLSPPHWITLWLY